MHATVCDYMADTVQNSMEAGATRVDVELVEDGETVRVAIKDNGKGMDDSTQRRVWNPFYSEAGKHDKRRVGLGLPFLRQAVEATGGTVSLESEPGRGTTLEYSFGAKHLDMPPLGNVPRTIISLMNYAEQCELRFTRSRGGRSYTIGRQELVDALGNLDEVGNIVLAREFLEGQESDLLEQDCAAAHGRETAEPA